MFVILLLYGLIDGLGHPDYRVRNYCDRALTFICLDVMDIRPFLNRGSCSLCPEIKHRSIALIARYESISLADSDIPFPQDFGIELGSQKWNTLYTKATGNNAFDNPFAYFDIATAKTMSRIYLKEMFNEGKSRHHILGLIDATNSATRQAIKNSSSQSGTDRGPEAREPPLAIPPT